MKRLLTLLLCLCLILVDLAVFPGTDALADGIPQNLLGIEVQGFELGITGSSAYITLYKGDDQVESLSIPSTLTGDDTTYTIVGIGENAFYGRASQMKTVILPGSVTTIAGNAFASCPKLSTVRYDGMREKWDSEVTKGNNWDGGSNVKVICRITRTVRFRVEHGSWDDGTENEKQAGATGYEDEVMLKPSDIPAVGSKPSTGYQAGSWDRTPSASEVLTEDLVFTYTYASIVYGEPEWTWAEDYSTAKAKFKAATGSDTLTVDATVTSVTADATCTAEGRTVYTAKVSFQGKDYQDTKTVTIPKTGHTAGESVRENEVAAGCTTEGSYEDAVYCKICGEEISREKTTIPKLGHEWGEKTVKKKASTTDEGEYKQVCVRDSSHVRTGTIPKDNIEISLKNGKKTYKAKSKKEETKIYPISVKNGKGRELKYSISVKYDNKYDKKYRRIRISANKGKLRILKQLKGKCKVTIKVVVPATAEYKMLTKKFKITIKPKKTK